MRDRGAGSCAVAVEAAVRAVRDGLEVRQEAEGWLEVIQFFSLSSCDHEGHGAVLIGWQSGQRVCVGVAFYLSISDVDLVFPLFQTQAPVHQPASLFWSL